MIPSVGGVLLSKSVQRETPVALCLARVSDGARPSAQAWTTVWEELWPRVQKEGLYHSNIKRDVCVLMAKQGLD